MHKQIGYQLVGTKIVGKEEMQSKYAVQMYVMPA